MARPSKAPADAPVREISPVFRVPLTGTLWEWNKNQIRKGGVKLNSSVSGTAVS